PRWKNTFFVVEFVGNPSRSGIHAFKLNPKGAGFELAETNKIPLSILLVSASSKPAPLGFNLKAWMPDRAGLPTNSTTKKELFHLGETVCASCRESKTRQADVRNW